MSTRSSQLEHRRALLRFIASSPLAYGLGSALLPRNLLAQADRLIESPEDAVNVFEFEPVMRMRVGEAHYTYQAQGADNSEQLVANREGFERFDLRPRRLVDVSSIDTAVELFGQRYAAPIFIAPCGALATFHPEGELAAARAARTQSTLQILSTVTNYSVEDVADARGAPIWYQLYPTNRWPLTQGHIRRAERAGCAALVFTVDLPARNMEQIARFQRDTNEACQACHDPGLEAAFGRKAMFEDVDDFDGFGMGIGGLTWDYVDRLKDATSMPLVLKGIVTAEDAHRALRHGADGLIVSNHGGRAEVSGRSTIESLSEVLGAVAGRVPVLIDSGFRRGTDVFKALALGADAICVGRPYLWGLGSFGQPGVEHVLALLNRELGIVMQQMGTTSLAEINRTSIMRA